MIIKKSFRAFKKYAKGEQLMYGSEKLNSHYILRFALTKEFFEAFAPLKYHGIELPLVITRAYHLFIQPILNQKLTDAPLVTELQQKHMLFQASDAQKALLRLPKPSRALLHDKQRKSILLP